MAVGEGHLTHPVALLFSHQNQLAQWECAIHLRHIYTLCICSSVKELLAEFSSGRRQEELEEQLLQISPSCEPSPWGQEVALGLAKVSCPRVDQLSFERGNL